MPYSTSPAVVMILREGRKAFTSPTTLTLGILLVLACAICIGCDGGGKGEVEFETAIVSRGDIERRAIATGRIAPFSKVDIRSKVGGIIKTITVDDGDPVRQGQTIIELDKDILTSKVNEARAALEKAKAMHEQARIAASPTELESARKKYNRMRKLFDQGLATTEQLEDAETALTIAEQNHKAREAAVTMARAEISAIEAALERAKDELGYATIVSPMDGIVLSRNVDVGGAVASVVSTMGTLLITLGDMREIHMVGDVDESDIGLVSEGMPVRISVESYPDTRFHGVVKRVSPVGVSREGIINFEVEVSIENTDVPLRCNMTADAEIIVEKHENVVLVPQTAIRFKRNKSFVEVPAPKEESGKRAVDVVLGISGTDFSEVISGLKEGDEVIVSDK